MIRWVAFTGPLAVGRVNDPWSGVDNVLVKVRVVAVLSDISQVVATPRRVRQAKTKQTLYETKHDAHLAIFVKVCPKRPMLEALARLVGVDPSDWARFLFLSTGETCDITDFISPLPKLPLLVGDAGAPVDPLLALEAAPASMDEPESVTAAAALSFPSLPS